MQRLGMEEGVPIEHKMVTRAIERAQKQVEAQHFSVRKHLLEYDDVMNKQRESVYLLRRELLEGQIHLTKEEVVNSREYIMALAEELLDSHVNSCCGQEIDIEEWDIQGLKQTLTALFALEPSDYQNIDFSSINQDELYEELWSRVASRYKEKESIVPQDVLRRVERDVMLQIVDAQWKDHLYSLDHLKEGIGLRGYGQRNPLVEYKKESFALFQEMRGRIDEEIVRYLWKLKPVVEDEGILAARREQLQKAQSLSFNNPSDTTITPSTQGLRPARTGGDTAIQTVKREVPKVGRNSPCPCGSGKKYKKCHGA